MIDDSAYVLRDGVYHLRSSNDLMNRLSSSSQVGIARDREELDDSLFQVRQEEDPDPFNEAAAPQSEIVLFIARTVGVMAL